MNHRTLPYTDAEIYATVDCLLKRDAIASLTQRERAAAIIAQLREREDEDDYGC